MTNPTSQSETAHLVPVWDIGVRLFHWSLLVTVTGAFLFEDPRGLHEALGYAVMALVAFRFVWGIVGTRHARFVSFVPGPNRFSSYVRDLLKGREARYLGHNPAGGAMIIALLITLIAISATGYMMGMKAYFGVSWVEDAHEMLVNALLVLVALHVCGVAYSSLRHRENLVKSMVSGKKLVDEEHQ
jgi:cytochrome b